MAASQTKQLRRARGRINPPNMADRYCVHWQRHAQVMSAFQVATNPPSFDCTNFCTPIKNQGQCGSCWDFSGTAMIESANIKAGILPDNSAASQLSEQYTLDQCDGSNGGCSGDDNTTVLGDGKSGGVPLTTNYGLYEASVCACHWNAPQVRTSL